MDQYSWAIKDAVARRLNDGPLYTLALVRSNDLFDGRISLHRMIVLLIQPRAQK